MSNDRAGDVRLGGGPVHLAPLTGAAATAICVLARSLDLDCTRVDLAGCLDKSQLLERIAAALGFPGWFGHNWDALFDCLADLSWRPATGYVLVLEHASGLRSATPEVFDTALAILEDAAAAWQSRGVPFRAFVSCPIEPDAVADGGSPTSD
jgi:RNAse (barnase) inhibitor barstar